MSQTLENEKDAAMITTKAPKAVADGKKPQDWAITLDNPFYSEKEANEALDELIERFGVDRVLECAQAQFRVKFQAAVRSLAEAGKSDEEITSIMATWKPGDKLGLGGDPIQNMMKNFGNMTPEQQAALIEKLTQAANQA